MNSAEASGRSRSELNVASAPRASGSVPNSQKECWTVSPSVRLRPVAAGGAGHAREHRDAAPLDQRERLVFAAGFEPDRANDGKNALRSSGFVGAALLLISDRGAAWSD